VTDGKSGTSVARTKSSRSDKARNRHSTFNQIELRLRTGDGKVDSKLIHDSFRGELINQEQAYLLMRRYAEKIEVHTIEVFTDLLTGVGTSKVMSRALELLYRDFRLKRPQKPNDPTCARLIFFDMDGLSYLNNKYGHAVGDLALKTLAEGIRHSLRDADLVTRETKGGDEFRALIKALSPDILDLAYERLEKHVHEGFKMTFSYVDPEDGITKTETYLVTAGIGYADVSRDTVDTITARELTHFADMACNQDKEARGKRRKP
jgi:diguanylate cyclase (GGDEF)-like protein